MWKHFPFPARLLLASARGVAVRGCGLSSWPRPQCRGYQGPDPRHPGPGGRGVIRGCHQVSGGQQEACGGGQSQEHPRHWSGSVAWSSSRMLFIQRALQWWRVNVSKNSSRLYNSSYSCCSYSKLNKDYDPDEVGVIHWTSGTTVTKEGFINLILCIKFSWRANLKVFNTRSIIFTSWWGRANCNQGIFKKNFQCFEIEISRTSSLQSNTLFHLGAFMLPFDGGIMNRFTCYMVKDTEFTGKS